MYLVHTVFLTSIIAKPQNSKYLGIFLDEVYSALELKKYSAATNQVHKTILSECELKFTFGIFQKLE